MSKSKIPYETKVEIARDYLEGRVGYTEVPSRFMRKIICRLRLNEVSRQ